MPTTPKVDPKDKAQLEAALKRITAALREKRQRNRADRAEAQAARKRITRRQLRMQKLEAWGKTRRRQLAKLTKTGQRKVVEAAYKCVGVVESPAGSNRGPHPISACQKAILGYDGVAWCGCFAGWLLETFGNVGAIGARVAYCPYIEEDGRLGRNGMLKIVGPNDGEPGDLAVFDWTDDGTEDHVEVIVENLGNGNYKTVGGNTSFEGAAGSQSDGGCVAIRHRSARDFVIVRPAYQ
jgi:hypothetical protein